MDRVCGVLMLIIAVTKLVSERVCITVCICVPRITRDVFLDQKLKTDTLY